MFGSVMKRNLAQLAHNQPLKAADTTQNNYYVVFEKDKIFHEFDFENTDLEFEVAKSSI